MKQTKPKTLLILCGIIFLLIFLILLIYHAVANSAPLTVPPLPVRTDSATVIKGDKRTDTFLCYQRPGEGKSVVSLSYRSSEYWLDEFPADLFESGDEEHDIRPGDFAEICYQAEYSIGGEDGHHAVILGWESGSQISPKQGLASRTVQSYQDAFAFARTASEYPIQIYHQDYSDFVMIPAGEEYNLFLPDSDQKQVFRNYKKITKELNIGGETKYLQVWVLCNDNLSDEQILQALYEGTISENPDLFFVGYGSPYPYSFTANGYEQPYLYKMQKIFLQKDSPEIYHQHFMAQELENPEVFTSLPVEIQQELITTWNHADDVLLFGGSYDESAELTFNDDNRLCLLPGNGGSEGYVMIYLESGFFDYICAEIAE